MMNIATRAAAATVLTLAASWLGGCASPAGDENASTKPIATLAPPGSDQGDQGGQAPVETAAGAADGYRTPTPKDFKVSLKIKTLDCTGVEYGVDCSVTAAVKLAWPKGLCDPSKSYEVTYEITGGSDGPQTGTTTVTGEEYDTLFSDIYASAKSREAAKKLKGVVTIVEEI
jgi:hypothetical protein